MPIKRCRQTTIGKRQNSSSRFYIKVFSFYSNSMGLYGYDNFLLSISFPSGVKNAT
ncbi:hypothetical protein JCM10003_499 [Bacteroides pyogenes JCM 10003]|nr:hypothetical protein JCM10003_499 [Bacteroides pyogenes JCM 10003]